MVVRAFVGGPTASVGYLVCDRNGGSCLVVDAPPGLTRKYMEAAKALQVEVLSIVNTHGHWDHIADNVTLAGATGAQICAHSWDAARMSDPTLTMDEHTRFKVAPSRAERYLNQGDQVVAGDISLEILHTPGHSPGSICLYDPVGHTLFSGDTLLRMGVGRTDIAGGSSDRMRESLGKLAALPDDTRVYPGHGLPTTIGAERWLLNLALEESNNQ